MKLNNVQKYLNGKRKMPNHYKKRGLRYYNEKTDKNLKRFEDIK